MHVFFFSVHHTVWRHRHRHVGSYYFHFYLFVDLLPYIYVLGPGPQPILHLHSLSVCLSLRSTGTKEGIRYITSHTLPNVPFFFHQTISPQQFHYIIHSHTYSLVTCSTKVKHTCMYVCMYVSMSNSLSPWLGCTLPSLIKTLTLFSLCLPFYSPKQKTKKPLLSFHHHLCFHTYICSVCWSFHVHTPFCQNKNKKQASASSPLQGGGGGK